jgi:hypothetical protein
MSRITPRPLRMPPLAYISSTMAKMSSPACSVSWTLNWWRERSTTWKTMPSSRYAAHTVRNSPSECEPRLSASP